LKKSLYRSEKANFSGESPETQPGFPKVPAIVKPGRRRNRLAESAAFGCLKRRPRRPLSRGFVASEIKTTLDKSTYRNIAYL
jgi:hypothetical protein